MPVSVPRLFGAIVAFALVAAGLTHLLRPVVWATQGRLRVMRDVVPMKEGATLVPMEGEASMMREATKGSEWEVAEEEAEEEGGGGRRRDDGGKADGWGGEGGDGDGDEPLADLSKLPKQFAGLRDTVDISAEVRSAMMEHGWREPVVNTTSPRRLYAQLRDDLRAFVRSQDGHDARQPPGGGNPSIAPMGEDSRGVVYMALGTPRYVDRAALVGSLLLHYSPGTNITLFTDRQLWSQWTRLAEQTARLAADASSPAKAFTDQGAVGAWMKAQNTLVPWGRINPFTHVVFYDDIPWDTAQRADKAFAGKPGLNLSPAFFLKKIATFAAAPYHKTLFADADTCMCGAHLEDMWRELDDHELIHTIDPARNQGGNHAGWDVRGHRVPPGESGFKERNVGFILYRHSLKLNMVWYHMGLLLMEAFRIKTPILRNEQPAYTEAIYLWRHYLDERILDNQKDVCRKLDNKQKYTCVKGESRGYFPIGPLCGSGCRVTHEKCETKAKTSAAARYLKDVEQLKEARQKRSEGKLWGTGYGWDANPYVKNWNVNPKKEEQSKRG